MPTPDLALAERVFVHIQAHPETWEQGAWAHKSDCGTTHCFAGHAVALAYPHAVFHLATDDDDVPGEEYAWNVTPLDGQQPRLIRDVAQELLGLNEGEADELFSATHGLLGLAVVIENLAHGHSLALPSSIGAYVLAHESEADDGDA